MAYLDSLREAVNYTTTENGALTHRSTLNGLLDLFAMGGAYRVRSDEDCIALFKAAFDEDPSYALKCLFYLRDIRGGQGERRFFRVITKWLANNYTEDMRRNLVYVPEYGRWDDLYTFVDTPLENDAFAIMERQLRIDMASKTPSLLAKWLKSENTSSAASRYLATKTRESFYMTPKEYRKILSDLRAKIRVVERLMSENRWDEIEFDKIPSKAGIIYRNAFARRDIIKEKYERFAKSKETRVKAGAIYPVDIAHEASKLYYFYHYNNSYKLTVDKDSPERLMLQKYWDNLPDYYNGREENGIAVVDVSGSMVGTPMEAAVSLGAYIADKAHGPFANHFITFSAHPELVKFEGSDITEKFAKAQSADWGYNTNIEAVFNLLLRTAIQSHCAPEDMPTRLYIFSDMEFDEALTSNGWNSFLTSTDGVCTLMESIQKEWREYGYELPNVIFWNLEARHQNIPALGKKFSYVSGFSPVMIDTILSGKDGLDLALEKLNSERYAPIH